MTPFAFAHLSDPHLPLLPGDAPLRLLLGKRITGYLSWTRNRATIHLPDVLAALAADIRAHDPDHIVVTGDLANISTPGEFARAADWLAGLGAPADVTVTPGNHDAYAPSRDGGFVRWRANMTDDGAAPDADVQFPFVRRRGPAAFIGLSTAHPTPVFTAYGSLGADQLERLDATLSALAQEGACRIVALHHPPAGRGAAMRRKGLRDHADFARVIAARGAELVLHGHTHRWSLNHLAGPGGRDVPVLGAGSASAAPVRGAQGANWNMVHVEGAPGDFRLRVAVRGLAPEDSAGAGAGAGGEGGFATLRERGLQPG